MEGEGDDAHVNSSLQDVCLQGDGVQFCDLDSDFREFGIELLQDGRKEFLRAESRDSKSDAAAFDVVDVAEPDLCLPV